MAETLNFDTADELLDVDAVLGFKTNADVQDEHSKKSLVDKKEVWQLQKTQI